VPRAGHRRRRGRATSSPAQFGQIWSIESAHATQNVHSNEQMRASPSGASPFPQRSQTSRISSAMAYRFAGSFRLRTARNASCGTSTPPTFFMRFLPFFCFSSSLRFRETSPP
jgi:hypothetical protein